MNAPVGKSKTAALANVPAIVKSPRVPAIVGNALASPKEWKAFDQFVEDCDTLVEHHQWLRAIDRSLDKHWPLPEIETIRRRHERHERTMKDCDEGLRRFDWDDDDSRYQDDSALTTEYVTMRLVALAACYPNTGSPELFAASLLRHVMAKEPSAAELETTCRKLVERENKAFLHIGDVIAMLKAEQELWNNRRSAIHSADEDCHDIIEAVKRREIEIAEAEARHKQRRIEEAYRGGLQWLVRNAPLEIEVMLACGKEFRQPDRVDELVAYAMGCFVAVSQQRQRVDDDVRSGRFRERWELIVRQGKKVARRFERKERLRARVRRLKQRSDAEV